MGAGLDSMYHAMLSRVLDISRYGPDIVSMLRRVLVTVLICEEPVTSDGVTVCCEGERGLCMRRSIIK